MTETASLPVHAYLPGKGQVRILEYVGLGTFRVLTNRDEIIRVQRARLIFTKGMIMQRAIRPE